MHVGDRDAGPERLDGGNPRRGRRCDRGEGRGGGLFRRGRRFPIVLAAVDDQECEQRDDNRPCRDPAQELHERRGRDSNPRESYQPPTRLAGECLQPLGHLSGGVGRRGDPAARL